MALHSHPRPRHARTTAGRSGPVRSLSRRTRAHVPFAVYAVGTLAGAAYVVVRLIPLVGQ